MTRAPAISARSATPHAIARRCAERRWPVHRFAAGRKTPAVGCPACRHQHRPPASRAGLPADPPCHGFHATTTNIEDSTWWSGNPAWGVGVARREADLIVLDVDAQYTPVPNRSINLQGLASGFDTIAHLAALRRQLGQTQDDNTLRVHTPSGLHTWHRTPSQATGFRCSTGSTTRVTLVWQAAVWANRCYISAPTTRTARGTCVCEGSSRLPTLLPEGLDPRVRPRATVSQLRHHSSSDSGQRVLNFLIMEVVRANA
ncbi:bifunctional DNA primase/polymerase [Streptomyces sp. NPDC005799]|uniref:bifunctional DNA primase/polymerase n=1 Tax=Streptomyces sp. NPDC005799 TaxID=3154678 RepID=UPI003406F55B